VVRPSVGVNGAAEGRLLSGSRRCNGESAEIKATFQRACRGPADLGSVGAPRTRLWSEICDPLDRHGTRAVKADTFPRYAAKALQIAGFSSLWTVTEGCKNAPGAT